MIWFHPISYHTVLYKTPQVILCMIELELHVTRNSFPSRSRTWIVLCPLVHENERQNWRQATERPTSLPRQSRSWRRHYDPETTNVLLPSIKKSIPQAVSCEGFKDTWPTSPQAGVRFVHAPSVISFWRSTVGKKHFTKLCWSVWYFYSSITLLIQW